MNSEKRNSDRWPFDPMQPGDHEPARLPEELERVQKQTGRAARREPERGATGEKRK
jgi:hypothetical protein